ncbi:hypothetical protein B188_23060 [Candidatus Brocadiaceae bacterium B188]|nr:hypothetical protein [Candidatus Brocadia sapporoensis]QQR65582.1 MAG: hypothetical protein IPI25_08275 [Candidatus Brocadia sp.]RZV59919.1 MAG: hypothetical protein EX330_01760 [Candidatus Brocadia sp. BROELEC01]TWU49883.1 hypothetical protein B188_23060 [Candidatus Brocadiaceae bacterium B188]
MNNKITWPEGKGFAFTIFDDTDLATLENVREVYSFLADHGFRTTKSVWPIRGAEEPRIGGATCEDKEYLTWIYHLKDRGFEIGYHSATFHSSSRSETIRGVEKFKELFGNQPKCTAFHHDNQENVYWGEYRLSGLNRFVYNVVSRGKYKNLFRGHREGDEYFWGDICKENITYVRNFVFTGINTLKACPMMPYYDPQRPFVNYWFASSDGPDVETFNDCITEINQDRLEEENGACIMYTHFGKDFYKDGNINSQFKFLMKRLRRKNGWFVPVSTLLDYLLKVNGKHTISDRERKGLERKWLFQ